jgi:hypothetical protein
LELLPPFKNTLGKKINETFAQKILWSRCSALGFWYIKLSVCFAANGLGGAEGSKKKLPWAIAFLFWLLFFLDEFDTKKKLIESNKKLQILQNKYNILNDDLKKQTDKHDQLAVGNEKLESEKNDFQKKFNDSSSENNLLKAENRKLQNKLNAQTEQYEKLKLEKNKLQKDLETKTAEHNKIEVGKE